MFDVHPRFENVALTAFKKVSKNKPFQIYLSPKDTDYRDPADIMFVIQKVKPFISKIEFIGNFRFDDFKLMSSDEELMENVANHCSSEITEMKLKYIDTKLQMKYLEQFQQLKKLKYHFNHFRGQMVHLPNLTHLHATIVPERQRFEQCDAMQHFHCDRTPNITNTNLMAFLKLNPQLKCVKLFVKFACSCQINYDVVSREFLAFMNENLPGLEKLKLDFGKNVHFNIVSTYEPLYFMNLKKLTINVYGNSIQLFNYLAISNLNLEEITFFGTIVSRSVFSSIGRYSSLKKLTIHVKELCCTCTRLDIIELLRVCEALKYLYIKCDRSINPRIFNGNFCKEICDFLKSRINTEITFLIGQRKIEISASLIRDNLNQL